MVSHVKNWPAYLLNNIPPTTTTALIQRAIDEDLSVNDVIRQALCQRYALDCEPESMTHVAGLYKGGSILIRLQPELYKLIKKETRNQYGAVRTLILTTLADYLEAQ